MTSALYSSGPRHAVATPRTLAGLTTRHDPRVVLGRFRYPRVEPTAAPVPVVGPGPIVTLVVAAVALAVAAFAWQSVNARRLRRPRREREHVAHVVSCLVSGLRGQQRSRCAS